MPTPETSSSAVRPDTERSVPRRSGASEEAPKPKLPRSRRSPFLRLLGWCFSVGTVLLLIAVAGVGYFLYEQSKDLPDYTQLQNYEPPVTTRIHAGDGSLLTEYARERRLYIPYAALPKTVIQAFLAAEDKNFFDHAGIDPTGILRAAVTNLQNRGSNKRPQGASTITQQVAKNFFLTNETNIERKIKEALLAIRMEATFSKEKILELYLNQIYLGQGAYGVAAASLMYFDKAVHELTWEEAAYLAALPKGPNNYHPVHERERAVERRNWVLDRVLENGFASAQDVEAAKAASLTTRARPLGTRLAAGEYFAEEVRREIFERFGEKRLYEGGLSVRTTLDPKLQVAARKALVDGLLRYDEARGYRGPVKDINLAEVEWGRALADTPSPSDIAPWRMAVVLEVRTDGLKIGLRPQRERGVLPTVRETGSILLDGLKLSRRGVSAFKPGDVIYAEPLQDKPGQWRLRQIPEVSGALVALDPHTGRVLAMVGGFSFDQSEFNRATQALRQPGSSFKPFVYAAALDNGYTPSTIVMDAPIEIDQGGNQGTWRPENYSGKFYGPQTLRFGLEQSRNVMTVRLTQDIGMPMVVEYAKRLGVYDDLLPVLSMALGAGETTLLRMTAAYGMLANGGYRVRPTLVDRIQDRWGATIYRHDERRCDGCDSKTWDNQSDPILPDTRESVIDPITAYQVTSLMEGVIQRGTGAIIREVGKPLAGKTGTTNDEKDAWFVGFSPDLVAGVYIGYDKPKPMGKGMTGGQLAAPVFRDFMKVALADKPAVPFRVPTGVKLIRVNPKTGLRVAAGQTGGSILEAFKPGTAPPDSYSIVRYSDGMGNSLSVSPESDRAVGSGTGALY